MERDRDYLHALHPRKDFVSLSRDQSGNSEDIEAAESTLVGLVAFPSRVSIDVKWIK